MVFYNEPVQTVLISCRGSNEIMGKKIEKDNIITVDWHMPVSFKPSLYAISIGKDRFSNGLIKSSMCFAVNFMGYESKDAVLYCGRNSGIQVDKFKETKLTSEECEKIDCPRIKEAHAFLECEVEKEIEAGDHIVFIGRILTGAQIKEGKRIFHLSRDEFLEQ